MRLLVWKKKLNLLISLPQVPICSSPGVSVHDNVFLTLVSLELEGINSRKLTYWRLVNKMMLVEHRGIFPYRYLKLFPVSQTEMC
jgi:hypothetical protein